MQTQTIKECARMSRAFSRGQAIEHRARHRNLLISAIVLRVCSPF